VALSDRKDMNLAQRSRTHLLFSKYTLNYAGRRLLNITVFRGDNMISEIKTLKKFLVFAMHFILVDFILYCILFIAEKSKDTTPF